ncbi:RNA polymerase sigma factor [Acidicapsa acidisoli]|uniref:hypothetical protein n=1 Tax=Acidicapsa acidisoli TaxID=1615681 RepID=UPI0021DF8668|nr:hypothetical protein [Acidicapsa acidisoli]
MPSNSPSPDQTIIAEEQLAPGSAASSKESEMQRGNSRKPEPEAEPASGDALLEKIAAELYGISSMLLGEGEEAVGLIEGVVANVDLPTCCDTAEARRKARLLLAADAITLLGQRDASTNEALAAPGDDSGPAGCIEDDDLSAAGVTPDELERMITGPEHHRLRDWLEGLSDSLRVIFVLRAIAALTSVEVAELLSKYGGLAARGWTAEAVRSNFRQALCSLASQLIHATATK